MLEIKLPWPDKALFPNARNGRHWRSFQSQKERARRDGFMAAKAAQGVQVIDQARVRLGITFYLPNNVRRDVDGMHGAIKHHLDGIANALGVDDSVFRPVVLDVAMDPEKKGFVLVEVGGE